MREANPVDNERRLMYVREPYPHTLDEALWMQRQQRLIAEMRLNRRYRVRRNNSGW